PVSHGYFERVIPRRLVQADLDGGEPRQTVAAERVIGLEVAWGLLEHGLAAGVGNFHANAVLDLPRVIGLDALDVEGKDDVVAGQELGVGAGYAQDAVGRARVGQGQRAGLAGGQTHSRDESNCRPHRRTSLTWPRKRLVDIRGVPDEIEALGRPGVPGLVLIS